MRRGDIRIAAARGAYTGKPRPVVIVQDDRFDATSSVTVCPLTTS
ncbi:MAG: type II toxin-antitoxin system PemK/MazF family toxin, partial [Dermatophilaceae bacterium]